MVAEPDAPTASVASRRAAPEGEARRSKRRTLGAIALVGLVLRVLLVLVVHPTCPGHDELFASGRVLDNDQLTEHVATETVRSDDCMAVTNDPLSTVLQARLLAEGRGLTSPTVLILTGRDVPGASRPPAWTVTVAALDLVGLETPTQARLAAGLLGALAVIVIGHLAWRLAGRSAGIGAALLAALGPALLINDWRLLNDGPFALVCALVLLGAFRFWERPDPGRAAALGGLVALGYYTRSEALLWLVLLVLPLALWLRQLDLARRLALAGVAGVVCLGLVAPFWVWNTARFDEGSPTIGSGVVLLNASCDQTYFGDAVGMVGFECFDEFARADFVQLLTDPAADESTIDQAYGDQARDYIEANARRLPYVAAVRVARIWGLYAPIQTTRWDVAIERRGEVEPWLATAVFYGLVPLSAAGLVHLRRRRIPITPFVAMAVSVTITAATSYGLLRFRVPVDVAMCVLGGIGLAALDRWWRARRRDGVTGVGGYASSAGASARAMADRARARAASLPTAVLGGGAAVAVVLVGVIAWSAGARPVVPDQGAVGEVPATVDVDGACAVLDQRAAAFADFLRHLSAGKLDDPAGVAAALVELEAAVPAELAADVEVLRRAAEAARDQDAELVVVLGQAGPEAAADLRSSLERVVRFSNDRCEG